MWIVLLLLAGMAHEGAGKHQAYSAPKALLHRIATSGHAGALPPPSGGFGGRFVEEGALTISPRQFGGDPTGQKDSTDAIKKCVEVCLNQSALSPNGLFPGSTSFNNGEAIRDMGGCNIILDGEYLISAPIVVPEYNANMNVGGGSLIASPSFPKDQFMIVIGKPDSCKVPQGSCNIDINFYDLFLDGSHVASTMQINHVMGVTIGPGGYFLNFTKFGVQINQGHEVMMDRCWLGETNFDYDFEKFKTTPQATAIQINGNDHYILNTIVFSSRVGVEVNGAANVVKGVHVWFPINRALVFAKPPVSAMAFHITAGGNRFDGCYADGGRVVFVDSGLTRNIWVNGFECCAGSGLSGINHGIILMGDKVGPGLQITDNQFNGGSIWHESKSGARVGGACSNKSFPVRLDGVQCEGLTESSAKDAASCMQACCKEDGCQVWQWCDPAGGGGCGCWIGPDVQCGSVHSGGPWTGASRNVSTEVKDTRIENNVFASKAVGTRARQSVTWHTLTSIHVFDFCSQLIFPRIAVVRSITVQSKLAAFAYAEPTTDCTLTVHVAPAQTEATLHVEVDASEDGGDFV